MPARNKLPRRTSIKRRRDIVELIRHGRTIRGEGFLVKWQSAEQFGYVVMVNRRHGSAVERNRLKRLFREAIRLNCHRLTEEVKIAVLPAFTLREPRFEAVHAEVGRIFEVINSRTG